MTAEAEEAYRTSIRLDPNQADAYHNLAILLGATGRTQEAVTCYCKALTLRPQHSEARRLLSIAYCVIGEPDKAIALCKEWLKSEPEDPVALHTLAAVSGCDVPSRASDAYVQKTFDSFAATFEAKLAKLHYQAPAWWLPPWRISAFLRSDLSMYWMRVAEPDSAGLSSRRMPAVWSEWIYRKGCSSMRGPRTSTTN